MSHRVITRPVDGLLEPVGLLTLPSDLYVAPIKLNLGDAPVHIAVIARSNPRSNADHFIQLKSLNGCIVYLGCLCDAERRPHRLLELWVMQPSGSFGDAAQKAEAESAWTERWSGFARAFPDDTVITNWESQDLPVGHLDIHDRQVVSLPSPPAGAVHLFREGCRLGIRKFYPLSMGEVISLLNQEQAAFRADDESESVFTSLWRPNLAAERQAAIQFHLLAGAAGSDGRYLEALLLKLRLFRDCIRAVRQYTQATQRPLLNITHRSFRIDLASGTGGPVLWNLPAKLDRPGECVSAGNTPDGRPLFRRSGAAVGNVYLPEGMGAAQGIGSIQVISKDSRSPEHNVMTGRIDLDGVVDIGKTETLEICLPFKSSGGDVLRVNARRLFGHEREGPGKLVFETQPFTLDSVDLPVFKQREVYWDCHYSIAQTMNSTCDLHALGVLGLQILLSNSRNGISSIWEEIRLVAAAVKQRPQDTSPSSAVLNLFREQPERLAVVGPREVDLAGFGRSESQPPIPSTFWAEIMVTLLSFFPGVSDVCLCPDFEAAAVSRPEDVFNDSLARLETVINRTSSLLLEDPGRNREIRQIIASVLQQIQE